MLRPFYHKRVIDERHFGPRGACDMGAASVHPTELTLQSYGLGNLDDATADSVDEHLSSCSECQRRVAELSSDDFLERLREAREPQQGSNADWARL